MISGYGDYIETFLVLEGMQRVTTESRKHEVLGFVFLMQMMNGVKIICMKFMI